MRTTREHLWFLANLVRVQVGSEDTGGAWCMVELWGPKGDMPPLHVHHRENEAFHVLEGELTLITAAGETRLREGESTVAPRGVPHVYRVESDRARWLVVCSPSGFERFVTEAAEPARAPTLPTGGPAADPKRLAALAASHRIEILGPPGTLPS